MDVQWYPGHMAKAKRMMEENRKLVDLIVELVDARIPRSSRNPDIDGLAGNKYRLILLNKADLADPAGNDRWKQYFQAQGVSAATVNSREGRGVKAIQGLIQEICREKIERDRKRGIRNRPIRAMVVGIPNVGKSTFINSFAGRACAKTGNKPGVTKGKQWIKINPYIELLDTPGILWPKFEDQTVGRHLAMIGSIRDEILVTTEMALALIRELDVRYPGALQRTYQIEPEPDPARVLEQIAAVRNCKKTGDEPDYEKAAALLLDDFRRGKLGALTLELPEEVGEA